MFKRTTFLLHLLCLVCVFETDDRKSRISVALADSLDFRLLPFNATVSEHDTTALPGGATGIADDQVYFVNWPCKYLELSTSCNKPATKNFNYSFSVVNFAVVAATLPGTVYSIQNIIPQLSIRALMIATICCAVFFPAGQVVFSTGNY